MLISASATIALLSGSTGQYPPLRTNVRAATIMQNDAPIVDFSGAPKLNVDGTFEGYNAEGNKVVTDGNQGNYRKLSDRLKEADVERRACLPISVSYEAPIRSRHVVDKQDGLIRMSPSKKYGVCLCIESPPSRCQITTCLERSCRW